MASSDECYEQPEPVYLDLATESEDPSVTQLETICMNCLKKGTTRLLLTLIPHFREVMVSSFSCPHCHHSNSSLLNTGTVQDKGVKYQLQVRNMADLKRMIVKSDYATIKIPEVELEVPSQRDKGEVTTVEGVLGKVCEGLQQDQEQRQQDNPHMAQQIQDFIDKLQNLMQIEEPFTLELNDPTGNSYIERLGVNGFTDPQVSMREYQRPTALDKSLGLEGATQEEEDQAPQKSEVLEDVKEDDEEEAGRLTVADTSQDTTEEPCATGTSTTTTTTTTTTTSNTMSKVATVTDDSNTALDKRKDDDDEDLHHEVLQFNTLCDRCHRPAATNMKLTKIPHFKEVVIMATVCGDCGNRTTEVKSGSGIAPLGRRIELTLDDVSLDLARDVLKSETCDVMLPELELHVGAGVLGGKFTTLEGLLLNIKEDIASNPFFSGDSADPIRKRQISELFSKIDQVMAGELKATIVLDDPAGNSYLQNVYAPDLDPCMRVTEYQRSYEQNEDLGLNDIKTEGYEQDLNSST